LFAVLYALVATVGVVAVATNVSTGVLLILVIGIGVYIVVGVIELVSIMQLTNLRELLARVRQMVPLTSRLPDNVGWNQAVTAEIRTHAETLLSRWSLVAVYTTVWSGGIVLPSGIRVGILLAATGYGFTPLWVLPAVVIAAYSVTVLPVSVGGIGVAEATASLLSVSLGYPLEIVAPIYSTACCRSTSRGLSVFFQRQEWTFTSDSLTPGVGLLPTVGLPLNVIVIEKVNFGKPGSLKSYLEF
jgi:uncharacterized membrane protein YbhN (UPF0104 family)